MRVLRLESALPQQELALIAVLTSCNISGSKWLSERRELSCLGQQFRASDGSFILSQLEPVYLLTTDCKLIIFCRAHHHVPIHRLHLEGRLSLE